jgi:hypothetical protein
MTRLLAKTAAARVPFLMKSRRDSSRGRESKGGRGASFMEETAERDEAEHRGDADGDSVAR